MQKMELVLLIVLISPVTAQVLKADCQDTTTFVGKSATITCTFSTNVSRVERPFLVTRFPLDSADFPEHVVDCTNGHCRVAYGYSYTERAGSQQIIEIPSAEKRLEGRYQCQYDTPEPQDPTPCTLLVQEFVVETPENSTPVSPETEGPSGDSEGKGVNVPAVVVPTAVVLVLVVAALVIVNRKRLSAYCDRFRPSKCPAKEKTGSDDSIESKTPLNPKDVCLINLHGEDVSCVDRSQQHAETEAEEGDKKSSADRFRPSKCPAKEETGSDNSMESKTPLNPQDACTVDHHGEDGLCVDHCQHHAETEAEEGDKKSSADSLLNSAHQNPRMRPIQITGYVRKEQDAEPLAMDTPTDNYQDNSPNEEKTSVDGLPDAKRQNPTTTPAFSTGNAKTTLKPQDACAINIHGKDGSCVDRSRSTGCVRKEQDTDPLAMDTPTDNYQDNSPNEEKTSVDGLPNAKRQNPTTTPAFSTGIADNPQHKVDIATDEDPSRNSACVSSPVESRCQSQA